VKLWVDIRYDYDPESRTLSRRMPSNTHDYVTVALHTSINRSTRRILCESQDLPLSLRLMTRKLSDSNNSIMKFALHAGVAKKDPDLS